MKFKHAQRQFRPCGPIFNSTKNCWACNTHKYDTLAKCALYLNIIQRLYPKHSLFKVKTLEAFLSTRRMNAANIYYVRRRSVGNRRASRWPELLHGLRCSQTQTANTHARTHTQSPTHAHIARRKITRVYTLSSSSFRTWRQGVRYSKQPPAVTLNKQETDKLSSPHVHVYTLLTVTTLQGSGTYLPMSCLTYPNLPE